MGRWLTVWFFFPLLLSAEENVTVMLTRIKPAVVLIEAKVEGEVRLPLPSGGFDRIPRIPISMGGTGSGFIIHPRGYLVTNGNVVQIYHERSSSSSP